MDSQHPLNNAQNEDSAPTEEAVMGTDPTSTDRHVTRHSMHVGQADTIVERDTATSTREVFDEHGEVLAVETTYVLRFRPRFF